MNSVPNQPEPVKILPDKLHLNLPMLKELEALEGRLKYGKHNPIYKVEAAKIRAKYEEA